MPKQVIVVVHGVGVRDPGVSGDVLSAALDRLPPLVRTATSGTDPETDIDLAENALRAISTDDFLLRELDVYSAGDKYATFPAQVRRFRSGAEAGGAPPRERLITDFYWGDVTGTGGGVLQVVTGIFRMMLGLTHVVRENAWSVFQAPTPVNRFCRWAAESAALIIHGPLFALNLMLAFFALSLGGLNKIGIWAPNAITDQILGLGFGAVLFLTLLAAVAAALAWKCRWWVAIVLFAGILAFAGLLTAINLASDRQVLFVLLLATLAGAAVLRLAANAFLLRHLSDWLVFSSVFLGAMIAFPSVQDWIMAKLAFLDFSTIKFNARATDSVEVLRAGAIMVLAAVLCWTLVILIAFGLLMRRAVRAVIGGAGDRVDFQAEAIGLVMLVWLVVTGAFWGAGLKLADTTGVVWGASSKDVFDSLIFVPMAIGLFLTLLTVMGATYLATWRQAGYPDAVSSYVANREARAEDGRLVVARAGIWCLRAIVAGAGLVIILACLRGIGWTLFNDIAAGPVRLLEGQAGHSLSILAASAAIAMGLGRGLLGMAIGIVIDVVAYINNYSWNCWVDIARGVDANEAPTATRVDVDAMPNSLTCLERIIPLLALGAGGPLQKGYRFRRRIQDRLRVLVAEILRDEQPDELLFIAHSQGTMIAADVIEIEAASWRDLMIGNKSIRLVTMGSPIRHIYSQYFPTSFPFVPDRPVLARRVDNGVLDQWVNIFRIDDFIGTHIDADMAKPVDALWPQEIAVPRNGHTMYWVDINVAKELRDRAHF